MTDDRTLSDDDIETSEPGGPTEAPMGDDPDTQDADDTDDTDADDQDDTDADDDATDEGGDADAADQAPV